MEPDLEVKSSKQDVEPDLLEYIKELMKNLQEKVTQQEQLEATIRGLEETLVQQRTERERVEANLKGDSSNQDLQEYFVLLKKKLKEKIVQQIQLKATIRGLEETLVQQRTESERVEANLCGYE